VKEFAIQRGGDTTRTRREAEAQANRKGSSGGGKEDEKSIEVGRKKWGTIAK
jgi:hypothetical protein